MAEKSALSEASWRWRSSTPLERRVTSCPAVVSCMFMDTSTLEALAVLSSA